RPLGTLQFRMLRNLFLEEELLGGMTLEEAGVDRPGTGEPLEEGRHLAASRQVLRAVLGVGRRVASPGDVVVLHPLDVTVEQMVIGHIQERVARGYGQGE